MDLVMKDGLADIRACACDIFLQIGQSNAEGCGKGGDPYRPVEGVLFAYPEHTTEDKQGIVAHYTGRTIVTDDGEASNGGNGNFACGFAPLYAANDLAPGRKVLVLQAAIGGTGFARHQWGLHDPIYLKAIELTEWALALDPRNCLKGFLWHQGEHDAFENAEWGREKRFESYFADLGALIRDLRARFGDRPFVCGDFTKAWRDKNLAATLAVADAMRAVCKAEGNAAFVGTDDLHDNDFAVGNGDDIHFCRESLAILGERYYTEYRKLVAGAAK